MFRTEAGLTISATDVAHFLDCRHLFALNLGAVDRIYEKPRKRDDPLVDLIAQRGRDHEKAFVNSLRQAGREVVEITRKNEDAVTDTLEAITRGAEIIVQGALRHDQWFGYTDILIRTDSSSALGNWSYEVADTKLARETRAGTIMQLGVYTSMLSEILGATPERFHVVVPGERGSTVQHTHRTDDYSAYLRFMQAELMSAVAMGHGALSSAHYPEPVEHCGVCAWWRRCDEKRHADDHLSLVAGLGRLHRRELARNDFDSLAKLAAMMVPLPFKPGRGSRESYERAREQAVVQLQSRGRDVPLHALRPMPVTKEGVEPEPYGLSRLPEPSPGDVFLDLEGDLFADDVGREYLFGIATVGDAGEPDYRAWWAITMREEREAFESVMDFIMARLERFPDMHIYHYAPYEPSAFKRLMGRHAVREAELDRLLRGGRFIDLYAVVRQAMWIGVESYSIKQLEPCYGFARDVDLPDASHALRRMEYALQTRRAEDVPEEDRATIEGYNRDDCVSTLRLRDWLEQVRADAVSKGASFPRPVQTPDESSEEVNDKARRVQDLRARLLSGGPDEDRSPEQQARWVLAYLLDFHRREDKATWWEYFRLRELPIEDLMDERSAVYGLEFIEQVSSGTGFHRNGKPKGPIVDRYRYPQQEVDFNRGDKLRTPGDGKDFGKVVAHDRSSRTLDLEKARKRDGVHQDALFAFDFIGAEEIEESLMRLGEQVAGAGSVDAVTSAAADLLLAKAPRLLPGERFEPRPGETATGFAVRIAGVLDRSVLAIQGPPGSGKTFTGAEMVCALVAQGKRVGVTASGHKVIRNLLDRCVQTAAERGVAISVAHKDDKPESTGGVTSLCGNEAPIEGILAKEFNVLGGTPWLWAREEYAGAVDVLVVDEAGQMSLANVAAVSQAASAVVLLGDPQQLDQPTQGTHPDGVGVSALEHLLGEHQTIAADRGIFLPATWRLAPSICLFTSELYYERKLTSIPGLEQQALVNAGEFNGSGLRMIEVEHEGNRNHSPEEVAAVVDLVERLTSPGPQWRDAKGHARQMTIDDILIVAPYNSQVNQLAEALPAGAHVGTVDKFQGQEKAVVIYSMATSRPEYAPRGMEFLYSPNRLNVATSRARCAVIVVASPHLFRPECRSVRQIKLANGLCRFRELATPAYLPYRQGLPQADPW